MSGRVSWQEQRRKMMDRRNRMRMFTWIGFFVLGALVVASSVTLHTLSRGEETCTVTRTERTVTVHDGNSQTLKLVYTKDCGVLKVEDAWYAGKFNSADTYGSIQKGHTYTFTTVGWRNGFFSWYPNILEARER